MWLGRTRRGRLFGGFVLAGALVFLSVSFAAPSSARSAGGKETVVFASNRTGESGEFAVYATDPVSGRLAQLATADAENPVPAPDGSAVAFTRFDPTQSDFFIFVSRSGGTPLELPGCTEGTYTTGSWSPDSKQFACSAKQGIEVVAADGSSSHVLNLGDWDYTDPAWSPDGKWIAYVGPCVDCSSEGVWVVPVGGGKPVRLSRQSPDSALAWSPDSKRLAFVRGTHNYAEFDLFTVGLTGAPARPLVRKVLDSWGNFPASSWSPNGRRIAVGSARGLIVVDTASGKAQVLTHDRGESPAWSPDGSQIAYMVPRTPNEGSWDIAVVRADGSHRRFLTRVFPDGGSNIEPAWSPAPLVNPLVPPPLKVVRFRPTRQALLRTSVQILGTRGTHAVVSTGGCTIWTWDSAKVPTSIPACGGPCSSGYGPDTAAPLAGQRIAWTCFEGGDNQYENIRLAAPPYRHAHQVAYLYADQTGGNSVGTILADGSRLLFEIDRTDSNGNVVHRSSFALDPAHQHGPACPDDGDIDSGGHTHGCRLVPAATNCTLLAADRRVIIESCQGEVIRVLTGDGRLIRTVPTSTTPAAASTDGQHLLILDGLQLSDYDIRTGKLLHKLTLPTYLIPPRLVGSSPHFASYIRGAAIHIIRLSDGADLALHPAHFAGASVASLDNTGLIYGYAYAPGPKHGAIGFLSMASIRRLFASRAPTH